MKIIIKESKRNQIVTDWLDKNYGDLVIIPEGVGHNVFVKHNDDDKIFVYRKGNGVIIIVDEELEDMLTSVFNINASFLDDIFIPWFNRVYNVEVRKTYYNIF